MPGQISRYYTCLQSWDYAHEIWHWGYKTKKAGTHFHGLLSNTRITARHDDDLPRLRTLRTLRIEKMSYLPSKVWDIIDRKFGFGREGLLEPGDDDAHFLLREDSREARGYRNLERWCEGEGSRERLLGGNMICQTLQIFPYLAIASDDPGCAYN